MKKLDPMNFQFDPILKNLQGNILKGHGRDHTTNIFIHFDKRNEKAVKQWLKEFAETTLTSCKTQLKERELFKRNKVEGGLFAACFLTAAGYHYLGLTDVHSKFKDQAFTSGLKSRLTETNDPDSNRWEKGFQEEIHALLLLADDDRNRMGIAAKELLKTIDKFAKVCTIEYGDAIRNANGDGLEHFGYVDGISQPLFLKDEVESYMAFHGVTETTARFNPVADTDLVLINDPYASGEEKDTSFGSYFVFRKLEQNVQAFKKEEAHLGLDELGGAYIVGRFEDGTPVVLSDEEGMIGSGNVNNFNYDDDPSGGRCPHFAHIRKTNPRIDVFPPDDHKSHIMARRGIPFGKRNVDTAIDPVALQMPKEGVGLLFMSYQASIINQFEFIQKNWANNEDFSKAKTGIDPVIGQSADGSRKHSFTFPKEYGKNTFEERPKSFDQFVTMKGGEYFFAPSINFFKNLR